jgi:HSP20 family protein
MTKRTLQRPAPLFPAVFPMAREMEDVQNRLRRFFTEGFPGELGLTEPLGWMPAVEIVETAEELILTAELPGMTKENVEVMYEDEVLTMRGEKKEEKKEGNGQKQFHVWERTYGAFQRAFVLPRTIDATKIEAAFKDGILTVHLPKTAQAKLKGRKIEVAAN